MNHATRELILAELKAARSLTDAATTENRDFTDQERAAIEQHMAKARDLKKGSDNQDELHKQLAEFHDGLGTAVELAPPKATPEAYRARGKSLGQTFVDSPEFKALLQSAPNGHFGEKSRVQSAPVGLKALLTGTDRDASAGALLTPQNLGFLTPYYERELSLRQLVTNGTTGTDVIEYVQLLSVTNNAAPVPEAQSTAAIGSGTAPDVVTDETAGLKPESAMSFVKGSTTVKTVAHWMPATKRALSDAQQIRTLIDSFLEYGLEEELEDQILTGDGTGENFLGLDHVSGVQTQAAVGTDLFATTRKARTKVRLIGRVNPTAYVMNPLDWERVDLAQNLQGTYYGAGPFALTTPRLWGLPVVESEVIPPGTAWCADWKQAVLLDREQADIQVTDSHADFFIRNLVAILAELRAAFVVLRPPAFVKITLPA